MWLIVITTFAAAAALLVTRLVLRRGPLTAAQSSYFRAQGFLVLRGFVPMSQVETMREEAMAAWVSRKGGFDPSKSWLQNSLLLNIHHHCPSILAYYFGGPLVECAGQLIGPNVKGVTSQLTFKLRGNTMPFGWHQDNGCALPPTAHCLVLRAWASTRISVLASSGRRRARPVQCRLLPDSAR